MMQRLVSFFLIISSGLAILLLAPSEAFAWGPGVHMVTGNWILQNLAILPPDVAISLMQFPGQFLHGALSADIFIGKGCKAVSGHSHNWESGFALLEKAGSPQHLSYAYGYLAHLAADTVAHNVFVPGLVHAAPGNGRFAHVYLEAQADRILEWDVADALSVFRERTSRQAARLLQRSMRQKSIPFWVKSTIFQKSIALGGSGLWKKSMKLVDALTPVHDREKLLRFMLVLSTRAIASLLIEKEHSPVLTLDPIGERALERAAQKHPVRVPAAKMIHRKLMTGKSPFIKASAPRLRVPIPELLLDLSPLCTDTVHHQKDFYHD